MSVDAKMLARAQRAAAQSERQRGRGPAYEFYGLLAGALEVLSETLLERGYPLELRTPRGDHPTTFREFDEALTTYAQSPACPPRQREGIAEARQTRGLDIPSIAPVPLVSTGTLGTPREQEAIRREIRADHEARRLRG